MNYKKIFSILVLMIFVVSAVPLTFAEKGNENKGKGEKGGLEVKEEVKAKVGEDIEPVRIREKTREQVRKDFLATKDEIKGLKLKLEKCKKPTDTTIECRKAKTVGKKHLENSADMMTVALERLKEKIEGDESLTEEEKTNILAKIDENIAKITEIKNEVVVSEGEESSIEDIKGTAKRMREMWKESKGVLNKGVDTIIKARLGNIIQKSEQMRERMQEKRDRFAERGYDVSGLDTALAEVDTQLELAKQRYEEAKALGEEAKPVDVKARIREAITHLKEAREAFRKAFTEMMKTSQREAEEEETPTNETNQTEESETGETTETEDETGETETPTNETEENEIEEEQESPVNETEENVENEGDEGNETEVQEGSDEGGEE